MEELPYRLAWDLAETAADIRDLKVPVDKMGWFSGETLEWVAGDVIREGLGTPAAYELIAPPRFRPLTTALPLFEQMLSELGCPSVDGLAAWWPEEEFNAQYPHPARTIGRTERLWFAVCHVSPAFTLRFEPLERDFLTAGELGRTLADLFEEGGNEAEIRSVATVLDDADLAEEDNLGELISKAVEWFRTEVSRDGAPRWAEAERLLTPRIRGWFTEP